MAPKSCRVQGILRAAAAFLALLLWGACLPGIAAQAKDDCPPNGNTIDTGSPGSLIRESGFVQQATVNVVGDPRGGGWDAGGMNILADYQEVPTTWYSSEWLRPPVPGSVEVDPIGPKKPWIGEPCVLMFPVTDSDCPEGTCPCEACQCLGPDLTKAPKWGAIPKPNVFIPVGDTSQDHSGVTAWPGEGYSVHWGHHQGGLTANPVVRFVDGRVLVMEKVSGPMGQNILRPIQQYDDRDNRTNFIYGQSGRLERIEYPNGLDEVYNFSPSWIGAAPYLQSEYSGVDISLVVRATGQPIAGKGKKLLFKHPKDVYGQVIPGCRPFAGDLLFRQYFESCRILDDVANPSGNETYDIPQNLDAPTKMQVMEYSYVPGTTLLASVSQFTCSDIYDANKSNVSEIVAYEYANLGGRARVAVEVRQMEGVRFHFYYTFKTLKDKHEQYAVETITQTDEQGGVYVRTLDDYGRVVSETITPQVGAGIESRLGDPLAAGQVEPASLTRNYEYATPNCACGDSPTAVIDVTANRRSDYVYDPMTGLLLQESHPNPAGGAGHADTVYMWQPAVSGDIYGAYRLVSRTEPDGAVWTYNYTVGPRINAAWGVKTLAVTMTSPSVSASTANPGPLVWHKTLDTSAPVFDANGAQACIVGHVQHELDADGLVVDYTYDSRGYLAETVRNLGGGDLEVRTLVGFDATGDVVSMTDYAGSAKEHAVTIARDGRGRPYSIMDAASGVQREQRLYYDRWDNLCVTLESNKTGTGGAPDDFGPNPRSDVARAWIRNEFHYEGSQLVMVLEDRRSLDRNDSGAIADANDARFVRSDFSYSPSGLLLSATLGTGSTTHFTYDGYGALYKRVVTDNASNSVTTERLYVNNALEVTRRVDGLGNAWDITRNDAGLVTRAADPAIATVPSGYPWPAIQKARKLVYDVAGRVLESQIVLVNGGAETLVRREVSTLDEVGRAYKHAIYDGTSATPMQTLEARFVGSSRTDKQTDPAGRFWTRSFDALGRVVEVQDCTSGNPDKVQYEYIPKTDFVLRETRQHWDAAASGGGQYVARVTEYERDSLGRPLQIRVGPQGAQLVHAFSYYSTGETESYTDPSGKVERYLPDARGRLVERFLPGVAPIWNGTTYKDWVGSDCTSELLQTDGLGHTTRTIFDFAGRPTVVMEPGATVMPTPASPHQAFARLMSYDAASRLATVYASEDIEIAMHRDSAGRLLQRRRVVDGNAVNLSVVSWLWWYDNLRYDALGEVSETNSYTLSDDEYIHETIGRDVAGRKLSESYDFIGGVGGPDIVSGFVGGDSFRSTVGIVNGGFPEDLHVRYAPDATGRVAGIEWQVNANGWKPLASYQHEGQSIRRRSMSLALGVPPGGQVPQFDTTYSYDAYGRMSKIEQSFSSAASVDFYFDAASNLVKEVYGKKSGATGDRFAYDEHHRLQTAWMDSNQAHLPTQDSNETFIKKLTYGLDAVHNRTTVAEQAGQGGGTTTTPYSLDSLSNRYGSVGGSTLIYDARGNLTFDGVSYYIYDAMNRLTEVYKLEVVGQSGSMASMQSGASSATSEKSFAVNDQSALEFARRQITQRLASQANVVQQAANPALVPARTEHLGLNTVTVMEDGGPTEEEAQMVLKAWYLYDAFNRRVTRWVGDDGVYFYAWDGWQEAQETIYRDQGGSYSGEVKQFVWGEQLDELVSYRRSTDSGLSWSNYYIAEGGAHCPVRVLNEAEAVVEEQEYDPYGRVTYYVNGVASQVSQVGNAFAWRGLAVDHETGLLYSRNRYLNVELGRFMSKDPIGGWTDTLNCGNGYAFGAVNPLTHGDPLGLQASVPAVDTPAGKQYYTILFTKGYWAAAEYADRWQMEEDRRRARDDYRRLASGVSDGVVGALRGARDLIADFGALFIACIIADDDADVDPFFQAVTDEIAGIPRAMVEMAADLASGDPYRTGKALAQLAFIQLARSLKGGKGGKPCPGSNAARGGRRATYVPTGPDGRPLPLPKGRNGELAPSSMDPHTQIGWEKGRRGGYVQTREFGPNGQPVKQVEWTDHGRPGKHTDPHVHDYVPNPTGGTPQHGPARPPRPGEL